MRNVECKWDELKIGCFYFFFELSRVRLHQRVDLIFLLEIITGRLRFLEGKLKKKEKKMIALFVGVFFSVWLLIHFDYYLSQNWILNRNWRKLKLRVLLFFLKKPFAKKKQGRIMCKWGKKQHANFLQRTSK